MKLKNPDSLVEERKREIEILLKFLEDEYRSAKISEQTYLQIKQKNLKKLEEINKKLGITTKTYQTKNKKKEKQEQPEPIKEEVNEEEVAEETEQVDEKFPEVPKQEIKAEKPEEKPQKTSTFKKIFGMKKKEKQEQPEPIKEEKVNSEQQEEPVFIDPLKGQEQIQEQETSQLLASDNKIEAGSGMTIELEKLKVIIDALKDRNKATDERLTIISENLGEMRSLIFQADGHMRENSLKMDTIEDQLKNISPKEIEKKFMENGSKFEKHDLSIDMITKKLEEISKRSNTTYLMLKDMGGVENLSKLNKGISKKIDEIKELERYIERLSTKTEKYFLDTNKNFEDFVHYKIKIDNFDDVIKDLVMATDGLNSRFENYITKKDLSPINEDLMEVKKNIENLNTIIPIAEMKMSPSITRLKNEKDDINSLLNSVKKQYSDGKMTKKEYENIKHSFEKNLKDLEKELIVEWKEFEKISKPVEKPEKIQEDVETPKVDAVSEQQAQEESVEASDHPRETEEGELKNQIKQLDVEETPKKMDEKKVKREEKTVLVDKPKSTIKPKKAVNNRKHGKKTDKKKPLIKEKPKGTEKKKAKKT